MISNINCESGGTADDSAVDEGTMSASEDDGSDSETMTEGADEVDDGGFVECEDDDQSEDRISYDRDIKPIWTQAACGCHGWHPHDGANHLFLCPSSFEDCIEAEHSIIRRHLLETKSIQVEKMPLVDPCDADNSYLVHKLAGTHQEVEPDLENDPRHKKKGKQMPPGGMLSDEEQELVVRWINQGANQ